MIPERIHASHIFLIGNDKDKPNREPEIHGLHRKLTAKAATFEELVKQFSEDENNNKRGGDLGWFGRDRVPKDFGEKVFAMAERQISEPFQTKLGWHIVLLHEKRAARVPLYDEVKEEVIAKLDDERRGKALKTFMEDLRRKAKIERHEKVIATVMPAE